MEVETPAAAAFINVAIENVINFSREMSPIRGLHKNVLEKLSKSLETAQMLLNNEEMTPTVTTEVFTQWLKKLGPVVFDADNVVDELNYHILSKETNISKPSTIKAKVLTYLDGAERSLADRINEINDKLESINKEGKDVGLIRGLANAPGLVIATGEFNSSFPARVFDDVLTLSELLITNTTEQEERVFSILAILDKSGMEKTTLAKKIFHCESIVARYGESRIWVHVGQAFDPIVLFTKILATFTSDPAESRDDILKRLQQSFIGKTFLLVLDDVWDHDVVIWKDFLYSLNGVITTKGNAIIITTRDEKVSYIVMPFHIHQPKALSEEECWSIIKTITFGDLDVKPGFEVKGKEIAQRCGSLPLAAYLVGGILRGKTQEQWESIAKKLHSQDEQKLTSEILRLSFQNLSPPSLKMCFAYCSIFPKGHKIVKQELIELWMAEGFLQSNDKDDMEFVGGTFINVLVHNSMLQVAERDENGNVESLVMHDLLYDLASSVSGSRYNADGLVPVRYLTLEEKSSPVTNEMAKHVRTLFVEGGEISDKMLSDYPSLRTLSLTRVKELPSSIKKLKHLRNLNISKSCITQLPEWIGELHNLQTLRADTKYLRKLPSLLKCLIKLRHLYVLSHVKLPAEMGRLTNLQTLRHFPVGVDKGYQIEELECLNNLKGEVHISNLERVLNEDEAVKANMHRKKNLSELVLTWSEERDKGARIDEIVLEGLQPHKNLKKLSIVGFNGKKFPSWTQNMEVQAESLVPLVPLDSSIQIIPLVPLDSLIQITLSSCSECEQIPSLENLSNLKSLSLIGLKKVRFMNSSSTNLLSLCIDGLDILEELPDSLFRDNPNLSKLEIVGCPKLKELPGGLDTHNFLVESWVPSLEILKLFELRGLENLPMVISCFAKSTRLKELEIGYVPQFMSTCSVESWHFGGLQKLTLDVSGETDVSIEEKVNAILKGCCESLTQLCLRVNKIWKWVPESVQDLTALSKLELQNLGVEELPEWFGNLSSLRQLSLSSCSKLKRMPSQESLKRLTKLQHLHIKDCPELQIGYEWHITPHLTIKVDGRGTEPYTKEIVDGSMPSAATEFLIDSLCNTVKEDGVGYVKELQTTLATVQSYLNDAQNKSIGEYAVMFWLRELQDVAFYADKVLDEFNYHSHQNKVKKPKAKHKIRSCFFSPSQRYKIEHITMEFNSMIKWANELGVHRENVTEPAASASSNSITPDPIFIDPNIIGRDNDAQILVDKLISDTTGKSIFSILAIVGMGGLGKATLTRKILNHEDIKARYGLHVWVLVSRIFDRAVLFKKILSTLMSKTNFGGVETEESILKKLQQALKTKTYILVLDDVWNEDVAEWKKFIDLISGVTSTKGNAIVLTTRNPKVASLIVKPDDIYHLKELSNHNCWSIIEAKAFPNEDFQPRDKTVDGQIAKRCQGLPLAANIIGGVLKVNGKETWLRDCKEAESISNILKLSFDCLPSSSLKMCFAYCSIFPKGCKILKEELIELWMAEGFLQNGGEEDMESMGKKFSNVLVHNSLLQVAERDGYGNVLSFVMHDLMHDLARAVSGYSDVTNQVPYSFHAKSLRTLIFQGEICDISMFSSYEYLHALSLDCDQLKELPSSIRKLIHLRNLNVSRTGIESLPDWISELHYLQTLNGSTESLRKLPSTLKYLISLRHLYLCDDVKLPANIGRLSNLQELKFRVVEHRGYRIEELGSLNNLKKLSIYNLEKVHDKEEAQKALISEKQNLSELSFEWDADVEKERKYDEVVLEGLEPHPGLKMLKIVGFKGKRFPSWAQTLIGLIEITLSDCQGCEKIPELGQLPNLKTLGLWRLSKVTSIDTSFYGTIGDNSFPALETLLLTGMAELKVIHDFGNQVKVFPRLVSLKIYCCNKLECLPSWLFVKARCLKELDIRHCSQLSRLPDDLHTLNDIESITIKGCKNLKSIVKPESGGTFESLCSLEICDCQNLIEMVEPHATLLKKVFMMELRSLQNLSKFLDSLAHSHSLAQLTIVGVPQFTSYIIVWPFGKLRKLEIDVTMESSRKTSEAIKQTVDVMLRNCCSSLGELKLTGLEIWAEVPESIQRLTALYSLELENFGVEKLPKWFKNLSYLKRLCLSNFPKLEHLPTMKHFTELQEFHICNCPKIKIEYESLKIFHGCSIYANFNLR